jgi:hypothetical protein
VANLDSRLRDEVRNEIAQLLSENVHGAKIGNQEPRSGRPIRKIVAAGAQYNSGIRGHFEVLDRHGRPHRSVLIPLLE